MKFLISFLLISLVVFIHVERNSAKAVTVSETGNDLIETQDLFSDVEKRCTNKYQPKINKAELRREEAISKCNATEIGSGLKLCIQKAHNKYDKKYVKYIGKIKKCIAKGRTLDVDQLNEFDNPETIESDFQTKEDDDQTNEVDGETNETVEL